MVNIVYLVVSGVGRELVVATERQKPHRSGRVVSVRLDEETIGKLDALAARTGRSRGVYLKLAIGAALPGLERAHWEQVAAEFEDKTIDRQFHALMQQLTTGEHDNRDEQGAGGA
ncbi:ribbon-helix-helix protein, CopG family [Tomitella cavernea]|uniref:Ribbon-helix-helix protein CopG domain-containing protein n=1 Tax=Tomitella cavernea TaxID=1387982 RepID=A0ABP9D711_9ACTN